MKKVTAILCIILMLFSFSACGGNTGRSGPAGLPDGETGVDESSGLQDGSLTVRVINGAGTGRLVLAGIGSGDVFTVSETELTVYLDDKTAGSSDLENGMLLTVDLGYTVLETWPAQLTGATVRAYSVPADKEDHGDICEIYLSVLEDLWTEDSGLNSDITYISVDLDDAPGVLTDGEKAAVAWIFSGAHGKQGLRLGFEELKENGYIDDGVLYWEDGALFSIRKSDNGKDSTQKITFDAEKWRSGTGAVFYMGCSAERGNGVKWKPYKPGTFAIS